MRRNTTIKRSVIQSSKEPLCRAEIPVAIQCDLNAVGGIKGLCECLPQPKSIVKMSATHHALSDTVRMTIMYLLAIQPLCVCVIKACIGIADSKLSYHLMILKKAELIEGEQQGNWIIYRLTDKGCVYVREE
jgi:predicted transcriptional regulator